eukprot:175176-Prymnesium_polylepis.1
MDSLLAVVTFVPILIAAYFEVPEEAKEAVRRVNPFRGRGSQDERNDPGSHGRVTPTAAPTAPSAESQSSV